MDRTIHTFERLPQVGSDSAPPLPAKRPVRAVPLVGVIRNPRSHRNETRSPDWESVPNVLVESPFRRSELPQILAAFAHKNVDYIVVDGGDGTVRDVLTCGAGIFGGNWPSLIVIPNGKTNALASDLGIPTNWTLREALSAAKSGEGVVRRPMVISQRDDENARVYGFILGAGAFARAIALGQDAHRWGAFNAFAVAVTAVWSLGQALFGSRRNIWKCGTFMRLRDSKGKSIPHSGTVPPDERYLLFVSTLDRFPAGMRPFRELAGKLRMAVVDNSRIGMLLSMPLIVSGKVGRKTFERGYHLVSDESVELDVAEPFILDGEAFPSGRYRIGIGPELHFVTP